jgi:plastocyanin
MTHALVRRAAPLALTTLAAIAIGAAAAAPAPAPAAPGATVKIGNFSFGPTALTVSPGTTVTWVNGDDTPHTVVAADTRTFRSKPLDTDERFSFTFNQPGTYAYFCSLHPHMTGKIIVQAS